MGDGNQRAMISEEELCELQEKRFSRILEVAAAGGNEVVILGAFVDKFLLRSRAKRLLFAACYLNEKLNAR